MKQKEQSVFSSLFSKLKWAFYGLNVKLFGARKQKVMTNKSRTFKKYRFLFLFLLFPMVQFCVFYIYVNFNSIMLAFKTFDKDTGWGFAGLDNFTTVWYDIFVTGRLSTAIINSTIQFLLSFVVGTPLHILVAYSIFRNIPGSKIFKFILFIPSMISGLVFVICFQYFVNSGLYEILGYLPGLLDANKQGFITVLFFSFWLGFAGGLVIYLGAMSSIDKDVLEYCELEQISSMRLLWSIVIPLIFPTITTYIVVGIAGFFTNQGMFHSFFGAFRDTNYATLGYEFFVLIAQDNSTPADYPYAAAGGLLFTLIVAPLTITVKSLLEKYGPGVD